MRSRKFRREGGLPMEVTQYDEGADRTACFTCRVPEWPNLFSHSEGKRLEILTGAALALKTACSRLVLTCSTCA